MIKGDIFNHSTRRATGHRIQNANDAFKLQFENCDLRLYC